MTNYTHELEPATFRPTGRLFAARPLADYVRQNWWKAIALAILVRALLELGKSAARPDRAS